MYSDVNSEAYLIVALINLFLCGIISWYCLCMLNTKTSKRFKKFRLKFMLLLTGAVASGLQPILWATIPDIGSCILSFALVIYLVTSLPKKKRKR